MKKIFIIGLSLICYITNLSAQNNTTQDFNMPSNTLMYATGTLKYNGETKLLTPTEQTQYEFKNGLLLKETEARLYSDLKIGNQKTYTYNANNELTNIADAGGIADLGASITDFKISYSKTGNTVYIHRNSQPFIIKRLDTNGKLIEEDFYDDHSKYILNKHIYKNGIKVTQKFNSQNKLTEETTEYLNKNNQPLVEVFSETKNTYNIIVTYFTYSPNGDLQTTVVYKYDKDKLKPNFEYFKDGKATEIPKEASTLAPSTTTFYNYSESSAWVARVPSKIISNEINVSVRALKTSDGQMNNINNQTAFMAFLDATYQKLKTQKP